MNRIVNSFEGEKNGPLVLVFGALHGNEAAGVRALEEVFEMLKRTAARDPDFVFKGKLVGLLGNRQAFEAGQRFIEKDLNRLWTMDNIRRIEQNSATGLAAEDLEMAELISAVHAAIQGFEAEILVLLDLHTTSAEGGIFCIPTDESDSLQLAKALHAPVILDLFKGVEGTLVRFAADGHFQTGGFPKHTIGVAFEAGQHEDPLSVSRSVSAIIHCLRATGCISRKALSSHQDAVLEQYSAGLPEVTRLSHAHHIRPGDQFRMRPGYLNFQQIKKGEHLADDITGPIAALDNGLILMPLYQPQGSDGFFIVQET